jgi:hypothetical protein
VVCIYCRKRLERPIVKDEAQFYHFQCYLNKDENILLTSAKRQDILRRLEYMGEILENMKNQNNLSFEQWKREVERIDAKYADIIIRTEV